MTYCEALTCLCLANNDSLWRVLLVKVWMYSKLFAVFSKPMYETNYIWEIRYIFICIIIFSYRYVFYAGHKCFYNHVLMAAKIYNVVFP